MYEHVQQGDRQRLHAAIAEELGLSVEELEKWMMSDIERETEGGQPAGRTIVFRESTPDEVLDKVKNKDSRYTAHTGVIRQ